MGLQGAGSRSGAQRRQHFAGEGANRERKLGQFGDCGACAEHVVVAALDGAQDFHAAAAEEIEVESEVTVDFANEGQALLKKPTRAFDFVAHQRAELGSGDAVGDDLVGHAEAAHVFLRNINAALEEIDAHVLPEVGELQGGAGCVGKFEVFFDSVGTDFAACVKHQTADGIG